MFQNKRLHLSMNEYFIIIFFSLDKFWEQTVNPKT